MAKKSVITSPHVLHDIYNGGVTGLAKRAGDVSDLTREEEGRLVRAWEKTKDPAALKAILAAHQKLLVSIVYKLGLGAQIEDAVQIANEGFIKGLNKFDRSVGVRLATYASWYVRAELQNTIMRTSPVAINDTAVTKKIRVNVTKVLQKITGGTREPTHSDLVAAAGEIGVKFPAFMDVYLGMKRGASLNKLVGEKGDAEFGDFLTDPDQNPEEKAAAWEERHNLNIRLRRSFSVLDHREREIFYQRRLQEPPTTLDDLGVIFGVSKERIRQIEVSALKKVKKAFLGAADASFGDGQGLIPAIPSEQLIPHASELIPPSQRLPERKRLPAPV